jgi:hypothetical protein
LTEWRKKADIFRAELPPGSPSWDQILGKTMSEIQRGAKQGLPGYRTFLKLLRSNRFSKFK